MCAELWEDMSGECFTFSTNTSYLIIKFGEQKTIVNFYSSVNITS